MKKLMAFCMLTIGVSAFAQEVSQRQVLEETIDQMCIERIGEYFVKGSKQYYESLNTCIEGEYAAILKNLDQEGSFANRNIPEAPMGSARACLPDEDCY